MREKDCENESLQQRRVTKTDTHKEKTRRKTNAKGTNKSNKINKEAHENEEKKIEGTRKSQDTSN